MRPVVTPEEMAAIDAAAPEPVAALIARAGWATARAAIELLGSGYGKRVAVLAGKGNNGADGRAAVPHLRRRGAHCTVFDVPGPTTGPVLAGPTTRPEPWDLVIDACYGTGLRGDFYAADLPVEVGRAPVLAVDIPSGVDGGTGGLRGSPLMATATVTFAAPKPGLLLLPGRDHAGRITVADIGLDCSRATIAHLGVDDLDGWPVAETDDHKWRRAVVVVGGGPGMSGAPRLAAIGALRAGAGYVTLSIPGSAPGLVAAGDRPGPARGAGLALPVEAVERPVPMAWAGHLDGELDRFAAAVVGPGLAGTAANREAVVRWWSGAPVPTVFDAGALTALAASSLDREARPIERGIGHVLTPHEAEFVRLVGRPVGDDRVAAVRRAAADLGAVVLLKGPTTVVADPDGQVLLSTAGDQRLATAGTGDVLAGVVAAGLAGGLTPLAAAGLGAELHGRAARRGLAQGLVASDIPLLVAELRTELRPPGPR